MKSNKLRNGMTTAYLWLGLLGATLYPVFSNAALSSQNQCTLSIARTDAETVRIGCVGAPSGTYLLEATPTLNQPAWTALTTAVADAKGLFFVSDLQTTKSASQFYRAVWANPGQGGIIAKKQILFSGGGCLDSFDSTDPNHSAAGVYVPSRRKANGLARTASTAAGAISVGTGHIYGWAATGPGGTVTCARGALGDLAWNASESGIQPGHTNDNTKILLQDISAPFSSGLPVLQGNYNFGGTNYTYLLGSSNYLAGSLNLSGGQTMVVTGDAVLYVTGKLMTSGNAFIYIAPGASLQLFVGGEISISGNGIVNGSQRAANCYVYGLNGCTKMTYSGNAMFWGVVDAPEAALTLSGSAGACGSMIASSITITGGASVHYDESLAPNLGGN